jgi:hypothetical protein
MRHAFMIAVLLGLPAAAPAVYNSGSGSTQVFDSPSIPPPLLSLPQSGRVQPAGVGRSGFSLSLLRRADQPSPHQYPFNAEGQTTGFGAFTRWGMPGGVELGGGIEYPFFVPYGQLRVQLLGQDWPYGPFVTLEGGFNAMPGYHGGVTLGLAASRFFDLHASYRIGRVLDRDYGEWGGGITVRSSDFVDIDAGASLGTLWGTPVNGDLVKAALTLSFGNRNQNHQELAADIQAFGRDPFKLYEAGKYEAAAAIFKEEVDYHPEDAKLWTGYADTLKALGQRKEAKRAYKRAKKLERSAGDKEDDDGDE